MTRKKLEQYQVLLYTAALLAGGGAGLLAPDVAGRLEALVWPALALLLYVTFCRVRPMEAAAAFRRPRFFTASLVANLVFVPAIVWG